jgi:hypothetical protein
MTLRFLVLVAIISAGLGFGTRHTQASSTSADVRVLTSASLKLRSHSRGFVIHWLRGQPVVGAVALGRDGETVDIHYRDGFHAVIVPRSIGTVSLSGGGRDGRLHISQTDGRRSSLRVLKDSVRPRVLPRQPVAARAGVFLPFAFETGGPDEANPEISDLVAAGFQVDAPVLNTDATIQRLESLAQYNVVYMVTHSGVDSAGHAIVLSGQPFSQSDASMSLLELDGSVTTSLCAGCTQPYWGITSAFVRQHMGQFPANALIFLNGCKASGTDFWTTGLASKGAGAMLSWDSDAQVPDEYFAAAAFFYYMAKGQTAGAALQSTRTAGLGTSVYINKTATLNLDGNGSVTLQMAAAGGSSNPTPTNTPLPLPPPPGQPTATFTPVPAPAAPTATPTSVPPTATATSKPAPTATSVPIAAQLNLAPLVKPGQKQQITGSGFSANEGVEFVVTFPNGDLLGQRDTADVEGNAQFSFTQPGSRITRTSNIATVSVEPQAALLGHIGHASAPAVATAQYAIDFGKIDVSVEPRQAGAGQKVAVYIHSKPRMKVAATVRTSKLKTLRGKTGAKGWVRLTYRVPAGIKSGETLVVRAWVTLDGHLTQTQAPLKVK